MTYALVNRAHQLGRGTASFRAATRGAMFMRRWTGTVGTFWAKCSKSPMKRRGKDNARLRPYLSPIFVPPPSTNLSNMSLTSLSELSTLICQFAQASRTHGRGYAENVRHEAGLG